jgi:hypothetical protein
VTGPAAHGSVMRRLSGYARERFPLAAYLPMILLAAGAALGYSRVARDAPGFAPPATFLVTALTLLAAFFALRVADEHKDASVDRLTRPELPVPRGLVTLRELRVAASVLAAVALAANALLSPMLLVPLAGIALWLTLMTREFFAREWLRGQPALYLASHMVIMPLLLLYATATDWMTVGAGAPRSLWLFLAASYATGLVLEIGRKIRAPAEERPGVETYTASWGTSRAVTAWLASIAASAALIALTAVAVRATWTPIAAPLLAIAVSFAAWRFMRADPAARAGKQIEVASAVWTLAAYALLALPWIERMLA